MGPDPSGLIETFRAHETSDQPLGSGLINSHAILFREAIQMLGNKYRGKGGTFSSIVDATVEWPLGTLKGGVNLDWECVGIP